METVTLIELFQPHLLAEAEAARVSAEQALRNVKPERAAERLKMYNRHTELSGEIRAMANSLRNLEECIQFKKQRWLDVVLEATQLAQTKANVTQMEAELKELGDKFRPHDEMTEKLVVLATTALSKASEAEKTAHGLIGKAMAAHEAHQANPAFGVGPIAKFKTLREAVQHFYKVGFSLSHEGEAHQACINDQIKACLRNGSIEGMVPDSLSWLGRLEPFKARPCPQLRTHIIDAQLTSPSEFLNRFEPRPNHRIGHAGDIKILCYVEETGQVLASRAGRRVTMPGKPGVEDFSDLFPSWEDALAPAVKELAAHGTLDLASQGALPMLGEIIREAWQVAAAALTSKKSFDGGQGRLAETKINELIGAYWKAFISSPWEPSIEGTYALLKHRCARGDIPNVYSYDTKGHFGFRTRTPDHDWIIGEIYCPPENFAPGEAPDPAKLANHESHGDEWLAELGPVKFCIRKTASRT
jgi:hypothetical protein